MTVDKQGLEAALDQAEKQAQRHGDNTTCSSLNIGYDGVRLILAAARAYLEASPSPSMEMEVVEGLLSNGQPLVTLSQAQAGLAAMRAQKEDAEDAENQAKDCFWAIYPRYLELGGEPVSTQAARTDLSAQVLRLTEENEALREKSDEFETGLVDFHRELSAAEARIKALEEALTRIAAIKYGKPDTLYAQKTVIDYARDQASTALKENAL